jgi:hypothetical protein
LPVGSLHPAIVARPVHVAPAAVKVDHYRRRGDLVIAFWQVDIVAPLDIIMVEIQLVICATKYLDPGTGREQQEQGRQDDPEVSQTNPQGLVSVLCMIFHFFACFYLSMR